ncbi:MAG TPA: hypothetical protein PKA47_19950 [Accumulibacter sp.]|jgi:hypothetical protein|uniref:hypothetical protein n=1 Tax=Accumulibacter sp. TaxID=2053492 RepID=UPI002B5A2AC7|nr:hypothetical protein [Accumulibacter sp.]HMW57857.1 hypothetical protein [Accumulibacter sp.]HNC19027.1 hypothetical protein [Accumulibacter sp.]HNH93867.1 hypothetical protein [Accumulibacter sp.]HNN46871.1 hypothetical protein [Azospira sp.]
MSLDKAALLALFAPQIIDRDVPGVGTVRLRELSAPEVSEIREACKTEAQKADFGFHLVIASVVDDTGTPTFTAADLPALRASAQSRIGELVSAVMTVNGFSVREDAAKN